MDEPMAVLGVKESGMVLELIRKVRDQGMPVILISHDMPHVFEVADRIQIMRLGRRAAVVTPQSHFDGGGGRDHDGRDDAAGMTSWGPLSTARINRLVLAGRIARPIIDVIAVASRDAARAEAYAREHGIDRAYGDYDALLADPDIEAVYVSLPNSLHVEWTLRALDAGKHVLCEKPFSRRAADVERAFDVADRAGLVLSEGFMWRHHPQTQRLSALVADGAVGRLRIVRAAFSFQLAAVHGVDDTRFRPEQDGGALMDVGCYCVNVLSSRFDEPERVFAEQVVGETGVDVCFTASLRFPRDVLAHFDCGFVVPYRDGSRWWATRARCSSTIPGTSTRR